MWVLHIVLVTRSNLILIRTFARHAWEEEAARVVKDMKNNPEASTTGIVLRWRLQLMMYNNMYRIMFDRRFESEDDPLFNKLKALNGERSRLAQSFEYNYGDFIPILRPFLRGYLKICKEVKERRLQLFKDYFIEERKYVPTLPFLLNIIPIVTRTKSIK